MFLVNSRLGHFTATPSCSPCKMVHINEAPLLPKLRGYFAEFLNESSLKRLRILTPPTCVGLRYGRLNSSLEVFLGSMGSGSLCPEGLPIASRSICCPDLPKQPPAGLDLAIQSEDTLPFCVTPSLKRCYGGTGILTCFPSSTPFGLDLGAD